MSVSAVQFLSTLSLRRATQDNFSFILPVQKISIHALLAESDVNYYDLRYVLAHISIHALLAESDSLDLLGWLRVLISIHALLAESDIVRLLVAV